MAKSRSQKPVGHAGVGGKSPASTRKGSGSRKAKTGKTIEGQLLTKHAGGRPPKFTAVDQMQVEIDAYFAECLECKKPPTVSGLAYALDMSTEALRNYEQKDEFLATIKKAKQRVEIALEERLDAAAPAGAIFNLKNNFGWKDAQAIDHSSADGSMSPKPGIDLSRLSDETIAELMNARRRD